MTTRLPIDKRSSKDLWSEQYRRLASEPIAWISTAEELLRAFNILVPQIEVDTKQLFEESHVFSNVASVAMMLGAFAIENLLKAIQIEQLGPKFDNRGVFAIDTHDLLKLTDATNVHLLEEERILLERLEQFAKWAGRYPVPLFRDDMRPRTLPNGGFSPRTVIHVPDDFVAISNFAEKLKSILCSVGNGKSP